MSWQSEESGYSLLELLMTLALIAIVLTVGIPSFGSIVADNRLRVEVDALFHAVHLARKDSIMRRRVVTLCPSLDGQNCERSLDWSSGWIRFVNVDRDEPPVRDAGEPVLQYHQVGETATVLGNRRGFTLRSTHLRATNGTLVFCDRSGRTATRALVISYTGRPRVTRTDRRGKPYRCSD